MIENTSQRDAELNYLGMTAVGSERYIEGMERAGQQQLLASCDLPTRGSDDPEFLRLGFTFGVPHAHDPLFRPATLPKGWSRAGTDHSMHTNIVDELGRERVGVFYKAAFYDRRADMHLITVSGYVQKLLWDNAEPVLDDEWATVEAVIEAARGCIKREHESLELYQRPDVAARNRQYATERVAKVKAEIAKVEAFIARVSA